MLQLEAFAPAAPYTEMKVRSAAITPNIADASGRLNLPKLSVKREQPIIQTKTNIEGATERKKWSPVLRARSTIQGRAPQKEN